MQWYCNVFIQTIRRIKWPWIQWYSPRIVHKKKKLNKISRCRNTPLCGHYIAWIWNIKMDTSWHCCNIKSIWGGGLRARNFVLWNPGTDTVLFLVYLSQQHATYIWGIELCRICDYVDVKILNIALCFILRALYQYSLPRRKRY